MDSFAPAAVAVMSHSLKQALSGIFGSISLTAWLCVLLPQLVANYKAESSDGLSMAFLIVWLLGDVCNLVGALLTKLAPSAIALAAYFCFLDIVLIAQTSYYKAKAARRRASSERESLIDADEICERSRLLGRRRSSADIPGSLIRHEIHRESALEPIRKVVAGEDETRERHPWLNNMLGLMAVYIVGFLGWFVSYKAGAWNGDEGYPEDGTNVPVHVGESDVKAKVGLALGYVSAILYLCARIPQILKNYREKSCEGMDADDSYKLTWSDEHLCLGLSLLFFMLSLTGNLTYGLSLLAYSQQKEYLITAVPWLLGSLGTMVEDSTIFVQFRIYGDNARLSTFDQ
ncbi:hypothetical protein E4U38_001698 [Claviceps purpurea]|nr:hypothetical protein E4U38_001698 [Claviceps purpurea]KAG6151426.1 hypothetical protein E4U37_004959 [Claviceps purpurea]KAG6167686.1 hypothetical protein E4U11_006725 [Claviceps purpurea]KAG6178305.1 hypothetical protein E4U27_003785 [Claviceps purpurea]KAG6185577.1 hypothetical protein E4U36_001254 [Claviceps purpurea]